MPAKNKIIFAGETLIDLTGDTVAPETLGNGVTAHDKSGAQIVGTMESGGGGGPLPSASKKDVNFYDYDGTILYSYTVAEAAALTELPALPSHDGLICQGWNWSLDGIKSMGRAVNVGAMYITDDGKTRIYIRLEDGRTSPMLGCCPNGTVTVDWGDGTEPDVLTGTSTSTVKWTPTHEYAAPGDYVIDLTVDGEMKFYGVSLNNQYSGILRYASGADGRNRTYLNAVQRIEIGDGVTSISNSAFSSCYSLSSVVIPDGVTSIGNSAFSNCYSLSSVVIPDGVTSIGNSAFSNCYSLSSIVIPDGVTSIDDVAFQDCHSLASVVIPDGVTSIGNSAFSSCNSLSSVVIPDSVKIIDINAFKQCYNLSSVVIPGGVTSIGNFAFQNCFSLASVVIPDSLTSIGYTVFSDCYSLSSIVIPDDVTSISSSMFQNCYGVKYYDFTHHTAVPTLSNTSAFSGIAADCEIRVPAALVDEWKAATNWATYADYIVGV
ncbi:MAG: leucine-rich repeat domain-containing protein [Candidatus Cryptobacteroides sp.]